MTKSVFSSALLALVLLAFVPSVEAQQAKKVFRIGYLSNANPATDATSIEVIRKRLAELGYIESLAVTEDRNWIEVFFEGDTMHSNSQDMLYEKYFYDL